MSKKFSNKRVGKNTAKKSKRPSKNTARTRADYRFKKAREAGVDVGKQCSRITSCKNLSCYSCRARAQRHFTREFGKPLNAALTNNPGSLVFLTIVPSFGRSEVGSEPAGGLRKFIDKTARIMRSSNPDLSAVCYVDVSLNVGLDGCQYWQWHIHAITTKLLHPALLHLSNAFGGDWCRKPVMTKGIYDEKGILEYISKPDFFLREDIVNDDTGEKDTRSRSMPIRDEVQLMKVLSRWGATQRSFQIRDPLKAMKETSP
jgi:hypothetical protein